jgi:hypothetical protein
VYFDAIAPSFHLERGEEISTPVILKVEMNQISFLSTLFQKRSSKKSSIAHAFSFSNTHSKSFKSF